MSDSLFEVRFATILHMYVQVVSKPIGPTVTRAAECSSYTANQGYTTHYLMAPNEVMTNFN